jgi:hypothetical protein
MKRKKIVVLLSADLKARLDTVREQGFTLSGYVRRVLAEALADVKVPRRRVA